MVTITSSTQAGDILWPWCLAPFGANRKAGNDLLSAEFKALREEFQLLGEHTRGTHRGHEQLALRTNQQYLVQQMLPGKRSAN